MKKAVFFIIILAGIIFFATTDFYFNTDRTLPELPNADDTDADTPPPNESYPNLTQKLLNASADIDYEIKRRNRVKQIFEKIDMSDSRYAIFRNDLALPGQQDAYPISIYEIHGSSGQGSLTYLNVKLKFINQVSATATINETGEYGQNSFYFNDKNTPNTAYLMVQLDENLYGFQYNKNQPELFEIIKTIIRQYSSNPIS